MHAIDRRTPGLQVALAVVALVALVVGSRALLAGDAELSSRVPARVAVEVPGETHLLASTGDHRDHAVALYGWDPVFDAGLREADVLVLGSSMAGFACDDRELRAFAARRGVRVFVAAFASEGAPFARWLLSRTSPRPRVVVVVDGGFFGRGPGKYMRRLKASTALAARQRSIELEAGFWATREFHGVVPRVGAIAERRGLAEGEEPWEVATLIWRARDTGAWDVRWGWRRSQPAEWGPVDPRPTVGEVEAARALRAWCEERAARLVLTSHPNRRTGRGHTRMLGRAVGCAVVVPRVPGLTTYDAIHLRPEAAKAWSRGWWAAFEAWAEREGVSLRR